jgi:Na+/melibiose symporter-like transporter
MFAAPLAMIVIGYVIYCKKYKITEEFYAQMIQDLEQQKTEKQ